jgi:hypothetical protein
MYNRFTGSHQPTMEGLDVRRVLDRLFFIELRRVLDRSPLLLLLVVFLRETSAAPLVLACLVEDRELVLLRCALVLPLVALARLELFRPSRALRLEPDADDEVRPTANGTPTNFSVSSNSRRCKSRFLDRSEECALPGIPAIPNQPSGPMYEPDFTDGSTHAKIKLSAPVAESMAIH